MSVLHLISDTARRGAQVFAVELAKALPGEHQVAALATADSEATLEVDVLPSGLLTRRKAMAEHDLVIAHGSTTLDAAALAVPRRFLYRSIGDPSYWLNTTARKLKTGALMHASAGVVALYPDAKAHLEKTLRLPAKRVHVIPNAAAPRPANLAEAPAPELPKANRNVLYVGALTWEKQVDHIIKAVAALGDVGLVVVGDGPGRETLEAAAMAKLGERARFVGSVPDPAPYYEACDVLALASKTEGQPAAIIEAALAKMPTVAYGVGGVPDMIENRLSGIIVPPDDIGQLSRGLALALDHADAFGGQAWAIATSRFAMDTTASQWSDLIERHI